MPNFGEIQDLDAQGAAMLSLDLTLDEAGSIMPEKVTERSVKQNSTIQGNPDSQPHPASLGEKGVERADHNTFLAHLAHPASLLPDTSFNNSSSVENSSSAAEVKREELINEEPAPEHNKIVTLIEDKEFFDTIEKVHGTISPIGNAIMQSKPSEDPSNGAEFKDKHQGMAKDAKELGGQTKVVLGEDNKFVSSKQQIENSAERVNVKEAVTSAQQEMLAQAQQLFQEALALTQQLKAQQESQAQAQRASQEVFQQQLLAQQKQLAEERAQWQAQQEAARVATMQAAQQYAHQQAQQQAQQRAQQEQQASAQAAAQQQAQQQAQQAQQDRDAHDAYVAAQRYKKQIHQWGISNPLTFDSWIQHGRPKHHGGLSFGNNAQFLQ